MKNMLTSKTNFKFNIEELRKKAIEFDNNGFSYQDTIIGKSIYEHLKENHLLFLNDQIKSINLNKYILFYCFKYIQYSNSYKNESNLKHQLKFFQISELTYADIFEEISNDALSFNS